LQIIAGDHFARSLKQDTKDLERLVWQPDPDTIPAELCGLSIELKDAEANSAVSTRDRHN
jgi:hypothetical protein